jgi:glucokinase
MILSWRESEKQYIYVMRGGNQNNQGAVIGIDLGGTKLSSALFTKEGEIIHRTGLLLKGAGGAGVGSMLTDQVLEHLKYARENNFHIDSVGICIPGISNQEDQTVWAPNIKGWEAYPLHRQVSDALNDPRVQVFIESDRNCSILGEMWQGNARFCSNAIFMAVGTGIGIGILADGRIINGTNGVAGAIGWLALDRPYSQDYDQCGHFEYHASGPGIARSAESLLRNGYASDYLQAGKISASDVIAAYSKNDPVAVKVMEECIEFWGMAVANLVSIFNPEKIIFGGGVFGPAIQFLDRIHKEARKWAQPISIGKVTLEGTALKGETGLYGAGYLALRKEFKL